VLDGRAEIPPRGRPGVTVPGALTPSSGPQIEQVADATRINTAYLPTHLPTARRAWVRPAGDDDIQPEGTHADGTAGAGRSVAEAGCGAADRRRALIRHSVEAAAGCTAVGATACGDIAAIGSGEGRLDVGG